ncbi:UNVERIFIED_ORG: DNA (cytosine-5)-methyltransferase 1 [Bradyrhizobium japonicum]|uniref:DNA cytosine methyltransferase n=1 Tax=Bradyrhizobium diazoefficiens TaxID=1355477 RepID=UPI003496212D
MTRKILVADLFCGAGGSSTGAERALARLGLEMELVCVNHWGTALETHQRNHPRARHYCADISQVRPHQVVPEGYLDLLMASPTCTHHSIARGGKPTSDQQRSDPWHVITWLTELRVKRMLIENVWEFTKWGPVDPETRRPIKDKEGLYFREWIETIRRLGATSIEWRKLNAADVGEATTRQRFFGFFRFDDRLLTLPVATHARRDVAPATALKPYRPAREIIDWSIKGRSIYARKKPLAPKTLKRIYAGIVKFGWPEPFVIVLRNHMAAQGIDVPLPALTARGTHVGLVQPLIINRAGEGRGEARAHSIDAPAPTATTSGAGYLVEPFVLSRHGEGAPRGIDEPTPTQVAKHSHCLISPYYGSGSGETLRSGEDPLPTVTAKARFGLVVPITHADASNRARDVEADPLPTLTTANRGELAFIAAQFGERPGQAPRVHDLADPAPAVCASGHVNLVEPGVKYDILFRMLEPHELAAAMGFGPDYHFAGTKTDKVKQIGNAVSVAQMEANVYAIMQDEAAAPEFLEAAE